MSWDLSFKIAQTVPVSMHIKVHFRERDRALAFERYLKSGSGRAFLHRHL